MATVLEEPIQNEALDGKADKGIDEEETQIDDDTLITTHAKQKPMKSSKITFQFIDTGVLILKVSSYVITFTAVLVGAVLSKAAMLLMTSQLNPTKTTACLSETLSTMFSPTKEERILWTWVLFFIFCIPELGTFVRSTRLCFFKDSEWPQFRHFAVAFFMESCHVIGCALLIFEVLPQLDTLRGVMLTNAVCLVPAVLKMLSWNKNENYSRCKIAADVIAILLQFSALIVWPASAKSWRLAIMTPALLLTSCGWWMNYANSKSEECIGKGFISFMSEARNGVLGRKLYRTYVMLSAWKMILFFCTMLIILSAQGFEVQTFFDKFNDAFGVHIINGKMAKVFSHISLAVYVNRVVPFESQSLVWLWIAIVQAGGAYVCYIFSKFACRTLIQEISMSIATVIVVPATILMLAIMDEYQNGDSGNQCIFNGFIPPYMFWNMDQSSAFVSTKVAWIWMFWLISQIWITIHIWFPACEVLARTEKIFATPMYSSIFIEQSICLNRRVDDARTPRKVSKGVPHVIACVTMWHETEPEMMGMLQSIARMDQDQCIKNALKEKVKSSLMSDINYYTFETHVFFDDAFNYSAVKGYRQQKYVTNTYLKDLLKTLPKAVNEVYGAEIALDAPEMFITPYGGRLVFTLPAKTKLVVHLKDEKLIRKKKRWSQCMYMYYLLGYRIRESSIAEEERRNRSVNTFLLALDGDIVFHPEAVDRLLERMKRNDRVGAACGRIHPVGSGLMAWYQTFEYAIGHWLQKSTEHMIGCVLCSPGCFSLFRGQSLKSNNVMKTYTRVCDKPLDHVQYDQGEDRWLCTLLLQSGERVEYAAASDAYTHCPEDFGEFFKQRRRWVPSTMANIVDLIASYKNTIEINENISWLYMSYQAMLMVGTILGPGTIFLMLVGAFVAAFDIDNWSSFYYNLIPIIIFIVICLLMRDNVQLLFALIISIVYGLVMMAVLVGILIQIQEDGPLAPSTLFMFIVAGEIIVAGLMHPQEAHCLISGTIYYITIPSMYLLLIIYSVCNLNCISWGTRETKPEVVTEDGAENAKEKDKKNEWTIFLENTQSLVTSFLSYFNCWSSGKSEVARALRDVGKRLESIERSLVQKDMPSKVDKATETENSSTKEKLKLSDIAEAVDESQVESVPFWTTHDLFAGKDFQKLAPEEIKFWKELIKKYLTPLAKDVKKEKALNKELKTLRNKYVLAFFMLNALFVTAVFLLQLKKDTLFINWPLNVKSNITYDSLSFEVDVRQDFLKLEPIGFVFVLFFAIILIIQFTGMLFHRFETMCHILATTKIFSSNGSDSPGIIQTLIKSARLNVHRSNTKRWAVPDTLGKAPTETIFQDETVESQSVAPTDLANEYTNFFDKAIKKIDKKTEQHPSSFRRKFSLLIGDHAQAVTARSEHLSSKLHSIE